MENIDVIGLLNAGYASPSMSAMTPPPTVNAIPSGLLSSGEAVTAPMNTMGMYNLLGDVPFSVSPGGEVYTPPQIPQFDFFDFSGLSLPTSGPIASLLQTYANNLANNGGVSPLGIPNFGNSVETQNIGSPLGVSNPSSPSLGPISGFTLPTFENFGPTFENFGQMQLF